MGASAHEPDLYALLGVPPNASEAHVRKAYEWAMSTRQSPERRAEVARAFAVLGDPRRRDDYDRDGTAPSQQKDRGKAWLVGAVVASILAGYGLFDLSRAQPHRASAEGGFPPAGLEEAAYPLGAPEPLTAKSTQFSFLATQKDGTTPVTWSPCRPIHYVVRPDNAPAQGDTLLANAFAQLSRATGLIFINDGGTSEGPRERRPSYLPSLYGDRWAPVVIDWATTAEVPDFVGGTAGHAGPKGAVSREGVISYVSGEVAFDAEQFKRMLASRSGNAVRAVLHELGHLVGLDHVDDPLQVMVSGSAGALFTYQAGDLNGLSRLGKGPCQPTV